MSQNINNSSMALTVFICDERGVISGGDSKGWLIILAFISQTDEVMSTIDHYFLSPSLSRG